MNPNAGSANDELVNLALVGLIALLGFGLVLGVAGEIAAFLAGVPGPSGGSASGLRVVTDPGHPGTALGTPGLSTEAYWLVVAALLTPIGIVAWLAWTVIARLRHRTQHDPHKIEGIATRRDIDLVASKRALVRRGQTLRPSLSRPRPEDVGYLIGRSCGREIWASVEDSVLVIGPPRSGKGLHLVINAILDAPGAVVTTSTRPDNIVATINARKERGPVAVFDPQHLTEGLPIVDGSGVRWSPHPRLRGATHRDDPSSRSRIDDRAVGWRSRVWRLLGRQSQVSTPVAPPRGGDRTATHPRTLRVVTVALGCHRCGRHPRQPTPSSARLGGRSGRDDQR
ncbi:type IV secretory system conjugative DNA transfer family protein [Nocardioides sp. TF02-7]|uniref:type IV secretory system conjugative DNA transfer family protein n=1 Tax=Nocardioides sp. TF02-7 TaxID=2917724 RepID=UPI001F069853|nr:type IV secretory system conjugative DNA transfer family protein [Nocardioides sp. TF02-7]UMG92205.1 type IV secretory system conjugative DNA transfer family protein [Nocardioides sp. TF02-7]